MGDESREVLRDSCAWCGGPIRPSSRSDAKFCSKRCRQASHRFGAGAATRAASSRAMSFGYADPPYPGTAKRYYGAHPDYAGEVDHAVLIGRLLALYPDGWALSTSAVALRSVLLLCPAGVRVAAWHRGARPAPHYRPLNAWEPVVYYGGRCYLSPVDERREDSLVHAARPRTTDPGRVIGAKPAPFAWWLFNLLGALPGDSFADIFPGSGGIARAWKVYASRAAGERVAG